jgi:maltose-binding protein MalE
MYAQQQPFYRGSKDGDVLVVYSNRAIIYDAKANKLVNVGPISRNEATPVPTTDVTASGSAQLTPTPAGTPAEPEKITVDVRNGTSVAGLAGQTATELKKLAWITVGVVGDAKGSFSSTVIVDQTAGKKPNAVKALETKYGVTAVTTLPKGEQTSTADVLVIVGK